MPTDKKNTTQSSKIAPVVKKVPSKTAPWVAAVRGFFDTLWLGEERDYFVENLSLLLSSGIDVISGLSAIASGVQSSRLKKIIATIKDDIANGSSLAAALKNSHLLSRHILALIQIGERSGRLSQNLAVISSQYKKDRAFKSKIRSAMMYPLFVLSLTLVIGVGIAWFILPKLAQVFDSLTIKLPLITQYLIALGLFLGAHGKVVVPLFFIFVALSVYFLFFFSKTKIVGQTLLFAIPGIRVLVRELELARFGYVLGTLLQAGLPVVDALDSLRDTSTFIRFKKFYDYLYHSVESGNSFQQTFREYKHLQALFPPPIQEMIFSGEQSGRLAEILLTIGQTFEIRTETTTKNLTVILEPVLLVIVWIGVMLVALAIILPIYSLIGNLNN